MIVHQAPIIRALLDVQSVIGLSLKDWDLLVRQGRRSHLLASLAYRLRERALLASVPVAARHHLESALLMVERHLVALKWEVECIHRVLGPAGIPTILLKGAAYVLADIPVARSRMFSDVDIIVPKVMLGHCESELMIHGWQSLHQDNYDQTYYRKWMHEIPPMRHVKRGTVIDVHHAILPETARVKVNTTALLAGAFPVAGYSHLHVLQPVDMFLHSATHLFHEGELEKGLRDLFDLDGLLRFHGQTPVFWSQLVPRALELGLTRPLFYALRYCTRLLDTPIPSDVMLAAGRGQASSLVICLMDFCYDRALRPAHASADTRSTWIARFLLYVRSHWIRMPLHLLVYHLGRKALKRPAPAETVTTKPGAQP